MLTSINVTTSSQDMDRFENAAHLRNFYKSKGIDGIELMPVGNTLIPEKITKEDINGIHLSFFPYWYDFWKGNAEELNRQFGNADVWKKYYGGADKSRLLNKLSAELDLAEEVGAEYVVFHVSESTLDECFTYKFRHTDEEICDAAAEIINSLLAGKNYSFYFLCENLWWSGFTMTRPEITRRLMRAVRYPKIGIMLDTGHLLHTNTRLRTQEEGVSYINEILDRNGELCSYIKGVHLQQYLSGEYVENAINNPLDLNISYEEKLKLSFSHIFNIDRHKPFTAEGVDDLIKRISPMFLTYELITGDNEEHEKALKEQLRALNRNGGIK